MTYIEKLEDILHQEKMDELQREIDELPDYYTEDWRRKYAKPKADLEILRAKRNTLESLRNSYIALGIIQTLVVFIVLWWISASY